VRHRLCSPALRRHATPPTVLSRSLRLSGNDRKEVPMRKYQKPTAKPVTAENVLKAVS